MYVRVKNICDDGRTFVFSRRQITQQQQQSELQLILFVLNCKIQFLPQMSHINTNAIIHRFRDSEMQRFSEGVTKLHVEGCIERPAGETELSKSAFIQRVGLDAHQQGFIGQKCGDALRSPPPPKTSSQK